MRLNQLVEPVTTSLTLREGSAFLFLSSVLTFPRSYVFLKLAFLAIFLLAHIPVLIKNNGIVIHVRVVSFYMAVAGIAVIWSAMGIINGGALAGIIDNLRLYVLWSVAFLVIFSFLLQGNAFLVFHKAIIASGILISSINFFALYNYVGLLGYIPDEVIKELDMFIGIHAGYIQITSHNIGSLFFITAYLMTVQFRNDMSYLNGFLAKFSLLMCLVLVVLSGRRALWVAISMVPFLILSLSVITDSFSQLRWRKSLAAITIAGLIPLILIADFMLSGELAKSDTFSHLQSAFSSSDERTIQKSYLVDGFKDYPILGSGFGAYAGYLRNAESPWLYELTYHQILFNFGLVGTVLFCILMMIYFYYAINFISQRSKDSGFAFSMVVAIVVFSIGAYSNPYFRSFDFLLLLGVLPLISASFSTGVYELTEPDDCENNSAAGGDV